MDFSINYLLESSICLLVFHFIYRFYFSKMTAFQYNRILLIGSYVLSFVIPLIAISTFPIYLEPVATREIVSLPAQLMEHQNINHPVYALSIPILVYILGVLIMAFRFFFNLTSLLLQIINSKKEKFDNFILIHNTQNHHTFSFFSFLFHPIDKPLEEEVKTHEMIHINQWHTIDVLISELVKIILWFNPIVYLMQRSVKLNHEYICDAMAASCSSPFKYAVFLSDQSSQRNGLLLSSPFAYKLKKRIIMLEKSIYQKNTKINYFLILPIILGMMLVFSCESYVASSESVEPIRKTVTMYDTISIFDSETFEETVEIISRDVEIVETYDTIVSYDYATKERTFEVAKIDVPAEEFDKRVHPVLKGISNHEVRYLNAPKTIDTTVLFDYDTYEERVQIIERDDPCYSLYWNHLRLRESQYVSLKEAKSLIGQRIKMAKTSGSSSCSEINDYSGKVVVFTEGKDPVVWNFMRKNYSYLNDSNFLELLERGSQISIENLYVNGDIPLSRIVLEIQ